MSQAGVMVPVMSDALSELEDAKQVPAVLSRSVDLELRQRAVALEAELAEARSRIVTQAARIQELEKGVSGGWLGGKWKARASELEQEVENLKAELARLKAERSEGEKLLPSVQEATHALTLARQETNEVKQALELTLYENRALKQTMDDLEDQRDERDSMLRQEEARRQSVEARQKKMAQQIAQMRLTHLRQHDPLLAQEQSATRRSDTQLARTRVLAALGNVAAQVELGGDFLDNTCAMCRASPACERTRLLNWPHGTLIPRHVQDYLQLLVDQAHESGQDPYAVLEAWASGTSVEEQAGAAAAAEHTSKGTESATEA